MKKLFLNRKRLIICIILFAIGLLVLLLCFIFATKQNKNDSIANQNNEQVVSYVAEVTPTLENDTVVKSPTNEPIITASNTPIPTAQTTPQVTAQPTVLATPTTTPQPTSAYATFRSTHFDFQFSYDYSKFGYAYSESYGPGFSQPHSETIKFASSAGSIMINPAPGGAGGGTVIRSEEYSLFAASGQQIYVLVLELNDNTTIYRARANNPTEDGSGFFMAISDGVNPNLLSFDELKTFGNHIIQTLSYSNLGQV